MEEIFKSMLLINHFIPEIFSVIMKEIRELFAYFKGFCRVITCKY